MNDEVTLEFPCIFPLKVMGLNNATFSQNMMQIIRNHVNELADDALNSKVSRTGKYLALTITFTAKSKTQLDNIYREINAHPDVRMTL